MRITKLFGTRSWMGLSVACLCVSNVALYTPALADPPTEPEWRQYDSAEWLATWGVPYVEGVSAMALGSSDENLSATLQVCLEQVEDVYVWQPSGGLEIAIEISLPADNSYEIIDLPHLPSAFPEQDVSNQLVFTTSVFAGTLEGVGTYSEHIVGMATNLHCNFTDPTECDFTFTFVMPIRVYAELSDAIEYAVVLSGADIPPTGTSQIIGPDWQWDDKVKTIDDLIEQQDQTIQQLKRLAAEWQCNKAYSDAMADCSDDALSGIQGCHDQYDILRGNATSQWIADKNAIGFKSSVTQGWGVFGTGAVAGGVVGVVVTAGACVTPVDLLVVGVVGGGAATIEYYQQKAAAIEAYNAALKQANGIYASCLQLELDGYEECKEEAELDLQACLDAIPSLEDENPGP